MAYTIEAWLREAITFYQPLSFFSHLKGSESAIIRALSKSLVETSSDPIIEDDLLEPEFDLFFLSLDPFRSLYSVMEFGDFLAEGNEAYVSSLESLANISRGAFKPENIRETWDGPDGPIRLTFDLNGKQEKLKVGTWGGAFDFRILLQINALLSKSKYRFEMAPLDDILFVTVLTAEEKSLMERERDLAFMVLNLPRMFRPMRSLAPPLQWPQEPDEPIFYIGTLNEDLDRCVGRLRFILRGSKIEGHHQFLGKDHKEDFTFTGTLNKENLRASGKLRGHITVGMEMISYEGEWGGDWSEGNRVATGRWQGWFVRDKAPGEAKPKDQSKIYKGQWALLEEEFSRSNHHHYISRVRAWLETVWESRSNDDYPWLLTPEE